MIGLMDCNNFFVSCERLFRPDLAKRPVAVLSSNDGCIVSRSQEVKDLGIPMGIPYFEVKPMCKKHGITLFSSNFPLYRDISSRVMEALSEEFDVTEEYSIDEAFFEAPSRLTEDDLLTIRSRILQKTGIPVSFGVATTKTIAKAASKYAKRGSGAYTMSSERWNEAAHELSCGSIWGIGRQTSEKLRMHGVFTVSELIERGNNFLGDILGVLGERLFFELTGKPAYPVGESIPPEHQSLSSTRSFAKPVFERPVLESAISYHVAYLAEKLRERGWVTSRISVLAAPSRFGNHTWRERVATSNVPIPTSDTGVILKTALQLLSTLFDASVPYKKAGVIFSGISPKSLVSPSLFDTNETKGDGVYEVVDALNARFGNNMVHPGTIFDTHRWRESKKLISPEYTTSWDEIASVKAI